MTNLESYDLRVDRDFERHSSKGTKPIQTARPAIFPYDQQGRTMDRDMRLVEVVDDIKKKAVR